MAITGHDLKVRRVTANVKAKDLASAMSVPAYALSRIERRENVDLDTVARYLTALGTCGTVRTDERRAA